MMARAILALGFLAGSLVAGPSHGQGSPCSNPLGVEMPSRCEAVESTRALDGASNFRPPLIPKRLEPREDLVFRSNALGELSAADVSKLQRMDIKTVVDFRSLEEVRDAPDRLPRGVEAVVNLPIGTDPARFAELIDPKTLGQIRPLWMEGSFSEVDRILRDVGIDLGAERRRRYAEFATEFEPQLRRFLLLLADESNLPLVFHCQGGKDRAGFASAVLLRLLGASESEALRDYQTTNLFTYDEIRADLERAPAALHPSIGAHREQLQAAFAALEAKYETFEKYLAIGLDLSPTVQREIRRNLLHQP